MIIAFRTDAQMEGKLDSAAKKWNKTRTEVIREAINFYLDAQMPGKASPPVSRNLAEALKSDIGVWNGPENSSETTGKALGNILVEKYRKSRL